MKPTCSLDLSRFYSDSYATARARFREASGLLQTRIPRAKTRTFEVPSGTERDLSVEYLVIPAARKKKNLIVVMSGIHGVEGYTGSAIQLMLLNKFALQLDCDENGYMLAHSMNPYGFKNVRRSTEGNVNLNRNFAPSPDMFKTENPNYQRLASALAPSVPVVDPIIDWLKPLARIARLRAFSKMSAPELVQAIAFGQFEFPEGLEYGGQGLEPQIADLIKHLKEELLDYENLICFDLHTGIGDRYQMHLIPGNFSHPQDLQLSSHIFREDELRSFAAWTPSTTEGFYDTVGDSNDFMLNLAASTGKTAISVTVEFGTIGNSGWDKLRTLGRLVTENQGYHHGYLTAGAKRRALASYMDLFAPDEPLWRANTIDRAERLFATALRRIKEL